MSTVAEVRVFLNHADKLELLLGLPVTLISLRELRIDRHLDASDIRRIQSLYGLPYYRNRDDCDPFSDAPGAGRKPVRKWTELTWKHDNFALHASTDLRFGPTRSPWGDPLPEGWDS